MSWDLLAGEVLCDNRYLRVVRETVATPTRPGGVQWMVAHRPEGVVVAPRTTGGRYLLIRQERIPVRRLTWEFPAGQIEGDVDERNIRESALRELVEETGYRCSGELVPCGFFYSSVGFTDERCHQFLATDVVADEAGTCHDEHEAIVECRAFTVGELTAMVVSGDLCDSNTLSLYAKLVARGLL